MPAKLDLPFTKEGLKKVGELAKTTKKRIRFRDPRTDGLLADATPGGSMTFWVSIRRQGKLLWQKIGSCEHVTIDQARASARAIMAKIESGWDPAQSRKESKDEPTLRELFDDYINDHAKETKKTWQVMMDDFERNLGNRATLRGLEDLSKRQAKTITVADVKRLKKKLAETPYVANRTLQLLRAIFNRATRSRSFKGENPVTGVTLYKEQSRSKKWPHYLGPDLGSAKC